MTYRQLIREILHTIDDLDTDATVRIRHRNDQGSTEVIQTVPVVFFAVTKNQMCIEQNDINTAPKERA